MAAIPDAPFPVSVKAVATNSFKAAHYISRLTNGRVRVYVGELEACIEAVTGGVFRQ
jgi:predicted aconitase